MGTCRVQHVVSLERHGTQAPGVADTVAMLAPRVNSGVNRRVQRGDTLPLHWLAPARAGRDAVVRKRRKRSHRQPSTVSESAPIIFGVRFEWDETYLGEQGPVSLTLAISEPPEIRWELVRGRDPGVVKVRAFTPEMTATVAGVFRSWRDDPRSRVASEAADLRADAGVRIEFDRLQVAFGAGHVGDLQPVDPPDYTFAGHAAVPRCRRCTARGGCGRGDGRGVANALPTRAPHGTFDPRRRLTTRRLISGHVVRVRAWPCAGDRCARSSSST